MTLSAASVVIPDRVQDYMRGQTAKLVFKDYYAFAVNVSDTSSARYAYYLCTASDFVESSSLITSADAAVYEYVQDTFGNYHFSKTNSVDLSIYNTDQTIFLSNVGDYPCFESRCDYGYIAPLLLLCSLLLSWLIMRIFDCRR